MLQRGKERKTYSYYTTGLEVLLFGYAPNTALQIACTLAGSEVQSSPD